MTPAQRDAIILQSAKDNLQSMAFYGLTEYQRATQYMFERTFKLKFIDPFIQRNVTHAGETQLTEEQKAKVIEKNRLDIELYQFAKDLFFQRLRHFQELDAKMNITQPSDFSKLAWENLPNPGGGVLAPGVSPNNEKDAINNNSDNINNSPGTRSSGRRRHKYRSDKEVAMAEEDDETGPRVAQNYPVAHQGFLVPLMQNHASEDSHPERQYPPRSPHHMAPSGQRSPRPDTNAQFANDKTSRVSYKRQDTIDYVPWEKG